MSPADAHLSGPVSALPLPNDMADPTDADSDSAPIGVATRAKRWVRANPIDLVFGVVIVAAFPLILLGPGANRYFVVDDWIILSSRGLSVHGLLDAHNGHNIALLIVLWKSLLHTAGLANYPAFLATTITAHLANCALLFVVCRRSGIRPWIAAITCSTFIFFGPGEANILSAFQISFTASIMFGLIAMVISDTRTPHVSRRDVLALGAGLAAMLFSSVGIVMVASVGVALLLRRGWRAAAFHVIPLAALFLTWHFLFPNSTNQLAEKGSTSDVVRSAIAWATSNLTADFNAVSRAIPFAGILGLLLVVLGLTLGLTKARFRELGRERGLIIAGVIGGLLFVGFVGMARGGEGAAAAANSRYVGVTAALLLPAIAMGCEQLARRWLLVAIVVSGVLAIGAGQNTVLLWQQKPNALLAAERQAIALYGAYPPSARSSRDTRVAYPYGFNVPLHWLVQLGREGLLPKPPSGTTEFPDWVKVNIGVQQNHRDGPMEHCELVPRGETFVIATQLGQHFGVHLEQSTPPAENANTRGHNIVRLELVDGDGTALYGGTRDVSLLDGTSFSVLDANLNIHLSSATSAMTVCTP